MYSAEVSAQTTCQERLAQAQSLYISGAFDEVEATLEACLQPGRLDPFDQIRAYRLLALSALQQGRLIEAKLVALSLLTLQPDYEADPVLDPPSYADLINTVRSQLAVSQPEPPVVDTSQVRLRPAQPGSIPRIVERQPGPIQIEGRPGQVYLTSPELAFIPVALGSPARGRRSERLELGYWSGATSFIGDFYRNDALDGYFTSDGPRAGMQVAYVPASWFVVGGVLEGSYHPKFPVQRATVDQAGVRSDALVGMVAVEARVRAWSGALISPYVSTGVSVIAARMMEEMRYGVGPTVGLGLDVAPTQGLSLFTEATAVFPLPEDAMDGSSRRHGDVFSGVRVGLRTRIGR